MQTEQMEVAVEDNARLRGKITEMKREIDALKIKIAAQDKFNHGVRERHQEIVKRYTALSQKYSAAKNRLAEVETFWINRQIDTLILGDMLMQWRFRPLSWEKITAESKVKPPKLKNRKRPAKPERRRHHTVEPNLISLI